MTDPVEYLTAEMQRRRISQRVLAMRSGVNHATISRILSGEQLPLWATVVTLVGALGATVEISDRSDST